MTAPQSDELLVWGQKGFAKHYETCRLAAIEETARLAAIEKWCNHVEKTIDNPNIIRMIEEFVFGDPFGTCGATVYDIFLFDAFGT
jgi:hypothetical protein